ncbi:hypothetical protein AAC387_Pa03g1259 [Persea americana]
MPTHVKRQKATEFQQLVQGNMTVQEYPTKFEKLSRYAPESINTVEEKIAKFLEGLNLIIERDTTCVVPPATFEETVRRAYKFENLNNKILKIQGMAQAHQQNHPLVGSGWTSWIGFKTFHQLEVEKTYKKKMKPNLGCLSSISAIMINKTNLSRR